MVEVADFVGLAAHAQDLGEFFNLLKLEDGTTAEVALRYKMIIRRV